MAFPTNPTNGQQTTQNGVVYTYNSTLTAWVLSTSTTGNISANAVTATGNISTGANFLGTGISLSGNVLSALNSTGNITAPQITSTGNINSGNVIGVNVISSATMSASANIVGGNLITAGTISAASMSTSGTVTSAALTVSGNASVTGVITTDSVTTVSIPLVLDDISNQCSGAKTVFALTNNLSNITSANITDSKNLQVVVSGAMLSPYITQFTYPWLTPYDSYPGYRVVTTSTSANLIIYNAPAIGSQVTLTIINNSTAKQTRKYPFSATTIALGD